jgi:transposase-like protein
MTAPSASSSLHTARPTDACPYCGGKRTIRKGVRRNKYGDVQLYYCHYCKKKFTPLVNKHRSFPLRVILDALTLYNRLYTMEEAAAAVTEKYGLGVSRQTVRNWVDGFEGYLPFLRLHPAVARRFERNKLLLETRLFHGLVYGFKYHCAKTDLILERGAAGNAFRPLQTFLENVPHACPHALFREERSRISTYKGRFDLDGVMITPRQNAAVKNVRFVLQAVANNKLRHETLQDFMLVNDSVTVAAEVPVMLAAEDCAAFRELGWHVPFTLARGEVITGHIDVLQIRYGMIHILDYKPAAKKIKPIEQLTIYALALSRLI